MKNVVLFTNIYNTGLGLHCSGLPWIPDQPIHVCLDDCHVCGHELDLLQGAAVSWDPDKETVYLLCDRFWSSITDDNICLHLSGIHYFYSFLDT